MSSSVQPKTRVALLLAGLLLLSSVGESRAQDWRDEFWVQPPLVDSLECEHGGSSVYCGSNPGLRSADDFEWVSPTPVLYIEWWGRGGFMYATCGCDGVIHFRIDIFDNVPAGADSAMPYDHPGDIVYSQYVESSCHEYVPGSGNCAFGHGGMMRHHCADLDVPFSGAAIGQKYWLSICWECCFGGGDVCPYASWADCEPEYNWGSHRLRSVWGQPWQPDGSFDQAFVLSNDFACPAAGRSWGGIKALYRGSQNPG